MSPIGISALIFTRNEEKRLKALLEDIKGVVDEVVIIDACSTDGTIDIAREYGARIFETKPLGYVEPCRMFGLSKVSYDYVLYLDCDERLNTNLKATLRQIVNIMHQYDISAVYILRRNYISSQKWLRHLFYPDFQVRIFRKDRVKYMGIIHEQPIVSGKTIRLPPEKFWIDHYVLETYSFSGFKKKLLKYAYLAAMQRQDKNKSIIFSFLAPVILVARLLKYIFTKRAFLDGIEGIKAAILYIAYLQTVDFLKAFRPKEWDKISKVANTKDLSFLCKPLS